LGRLWTDLGEPTNVLAQLHVKDVADRFWESRRLQRVRTLLMEGGPTVSWKPYQATLSRHPVSVRREGDNYIEEYDPDDEASEVEEPESELDRARDFNGGLNMYERFERLLASSELRRARALREFDFCRALFDNPGRQIG
jgi:hypothetical protein